MELQQYREESGKSASGISPAYHSKPAPSCRAGEPTQPLFEAARYITGQARRLWLRRPSRSPKSRPSRRGKRGWGKRRLVVQSRRQAEWRPEDCEGPIPSREEGDQGPRSVPREASHEDDRKAPRRAQRRRDVHARRRRGGAIRLAKTGHRRKARDSFSARYSLPSRSNTDCPSSAPKNRSVSRPHFRWAAAR